VTCELEGRKKRRQPKRWIDTIKEELKNMNVKMQQVMHDRQT